MELKGTVWRLVMTNGQEYFVQSKIEDRDKFLKNLISRPLFSQGHDFISLQLSKDTDPLDIKEDKLFSVQRARSGVVGAQTKIWKLYDEGWSE